MCFNKPEVNYSCIIYNLELIFNLSFLEESLSHQSLENGLGPGLGTVLVSFLSSIYIFETWCPFLENQKWIMSAEPFSSYHYRAAPASVRYQWLVRYQSEFRFASTTNSYQLSMNYFICSYCYCTNLCNKGLFFKAGYSGFCL